MFMMNTTEICGNHRVRRSDTLLFNRIHSFILDLQDSKALGSNLCISEENADRQPQTMTSLFSNSEPFLAPTVRVILHHWPCNEDAGDKRIFDDSASDSGFHGAGFSFTRFLIFFSYDCRSFLNRLKASA